MTHVTTQMKNEKEVVLLCSGLQVQMAKTHNTQTVGAKEGKQEKAKEVVSGCECSFEANMFKR